MDLHTQIITLIFSYIYGIFFSIFLSINYKIIYHDKKTIKLIGSFLVIMVSVLTYFILLRKINYAAFHIYQLFMIILGFYTEYIIYKKIIDKIHK